jgi:hypothetical protein
MDELDIERYVYEEGRTLELPGLPALFFHPPNKKRKDNIQIKQRKTLCT